LLEQVILLTGIGGVWFTLPGVKNNYFIGMHKYVCNARRLNISSYTLHDVSTVQVWNNNSVAL
jgi:hypothetical protein